MQLNLRLRPWFLRAVLSLLLVSTVVTLVWHERGMNTSLRIDASSPFQVVSGDDRANSGASVATLKRESGSLILGCDIQAQYAWPYCVTTIRLAEPPNGLDLTRYDGVRLHIRYDGPGDQRIRLQLRNYNPLYSTPTDINSMKVNEIEYAPHEYPQGLDIGLQRFSVASWWVSDRKIPVEHAGVELTNVAFLEIVTGSRVVPGRHTIIVDSIELYGKAISRERIRLLIIAAWMGFALLYLVCDALQVRRQLAESRRHQAALRIAALHDPLTGVLNRHGLQAAWSRINQGAGPAFPVSFVFIDLDHFKDVNDGYGHETGDEMLKTFSELIRGRVRTTDVLARWGGDEFLLVCPHTPLESARLLAETLRASLGQATWPKGLHLSCSFGVAQLAAGEDFSDGVRRADEALYRAKTAGRDRTVAISWP